VLIFVIPLLFLYSGQQFLEVSKANQERLEHDRIGLMHDVFVSLVQVNGTEDLHPIRQEIVDIVAHNPDIVVFRLTKRVDGVFKPEVALDEAILGEPDDPDFYRLAYSYEGESLVSDVHVDGIRYVQGVRQFEVEGQDYFVLTVNSREAIDRLFEQRTRQALFSLIFVYMFILGLAYWHIKLTDYRYLYIQMRKANEMKDLFTNMIAHELRAPLTAIRGYASMIDESTENEEERKYAGRVKDSAERLLAIVNDLLDVARIQSGKLSVAKEKFDVSEVVIAVTDELHVSAYEKEIKLTHSGAIETHLVMGDRKRLHQALTNLVSNAIKYTPSGGIELSLEEKYSTVEIRVKDTGMGISSEDQKKLFAPFYRVQSDDVSKITGTGLGMWITKQLIELMDGNVSVESIKGVGTHLIVTLPKETKTIDTTEIEMIRYTIY
jgi:signal transduction histidine kinase